MYKILLFTYITSYRSPYTTKINLQQDKQIQEVKTIQVLTHQSRYNKM